MNRRVHAARMECGAGAMAAVTDVLATPKAPPESIYDAGTIGDYMGLPIVLNTDLAPMYFRTLDADGNVLDEGIL